MSKMREKLAKRLQADTKKVRKRIKTRRNELEENVREVVIGDFEAAESFHSRRDIGDSRTFGSFEPGSQVNIQVSEETGKRPE
jgi:hypothetical protein